MNPLPHDPALPQLRLALDAELMRQHWSGVLAPRRWTVRQCRVDRVKYRPGHNLAVSYRLTLQDPAGGAPREQIVAARFCRDGDSARRASKAATRLEAGSRGRELASVAGPALTHDAALDMVAHWWPHDAKLAAARSLGADQASTMQARWLPEVLAQAGERGTLRAATLELVQVVPEHRCTVRARLDLGDGRSLVVYGKADAEGPGERRHSVMAALWCSSAQRAGRLSTPRPLLWQPDSGLHWQLGMPGRPLAAAGTGAPGTPGAASGAAHAGPAIDGAPAGVVGVGDALSAGRLVASLHGTRAPAPSLDPDHLRRRPLQVAALLTPVLPAHAQRLQRLALNLARGPRDAGAAVTLHGDLHPGNLLRDDDGRLHLIDLDGATLGPALLDLGDWIAETHYRALWHGQSPDRAQASILAFIDGYARAGAPRPRAADLAWAAAWQLLCRRLWRCCVNLKPGRFALVSPLLSLAETLAAQAVDKGSASAGSPLRAGRATVGTPVAAAVAVATTASAGPT